MVRESMYIVVTSNASMSIQAKEWSLPFMRRYGSTWSARILRKYSKIQFTSCSKKLFSRYMRLLSATNNWVKWLESGNLGQLIPGWINLHPSTATYHANPLRITSLPFAMPPPRLRKFTTSSDTSTLITSFCSTLYHPCRILFSASVFSSRNCFFQPRRNWWSSLKSSRSSPWR